MSRNAKHAAPVSPWRTRATATLIVLALCLVGVAQGVAVAAVRYRVSSGDTLASIADKFGYDGENSWRRLYNANPQIDNPDLILVGQKVIVPSRNERVKPRELPEPIAPRRETASASRSSSQTTSTTESSAPVDSVWTSLAACESGGNWSANTGNGYYGGLQFSLSSWQGVGGSGYPHEASAETQIEMGQRLQAAQGWGAWPGCAAELGLY